MLSSNSYRLFFANAISFETYLSDFKNRIEHPQGDGYDAYLPLNWQRTQRLQKTFLLDPAFTQRILSLRANVNWLLIAEHWCGDVSQSIPVIASIAQASQGRINLRIAYRDNNLELMDAHLTDGKSRSIPLLIQLDQDFSVNGTWGPRPMEAQELVKRLKSDPSTAPVYADELHRWYAHDKQQHILDELRQLIMRA
jgi:hypothetical protein